MKKYTINIIAFCIGILVGAAMFYNKYTPLTSTTDTVVTVRYSVIVDTVLKYVPQPCLRKIVDTVKVPADNGTCVHLIEQKEYKDSLYDVWISGCNSSLDSIKVFKWTTYTERIKTVTETKFVQEAKGKLFAGVGMQKYQSSYIPSIDLYYTKKDFLIGVTAGLFDNKPIYGININYKIK